MKFGNFLPQWAVHACIPKNRFSFSRASTADATPIALLQYPAAAAPASASALFGLHPPPGSVTVGADMACGRASEVSGVSAPPQMNTRKIEKEPFHNLGLPPVCPDHHHFIDPGISQSQPPIDDDAFSLLEINLFRDDDDNDSAEPPRMSRSPSHLLPEIELNLGRERVPRPKIAQHFFVGETYPRRGCNTIAKLVTIVREVMVRHGEIDELKCFDLLGKFLISFNVF